LPRTLYTPTRLFWGQQLAPIALEGFFKTEGRRHKDIRLTRLNFLNGSNIQSDEFGESLLRHFAPHPFAADIRTKDNKLPLLEL